MELHEVRYFLAVCETLNFTRAAQNCNVSQPALTRAIKLLEDKLGAGPLINRDRGNTHLTELGRLMQPYFAEILDQVGEAQTLAKTFRSHGGSIRIGLMCTLGPRRLVDFMADFSKGRNGLEIHLEDGPVDLIEDRLMKGSLDVALYCRPQGLTDQLHAVSLFRERFMVALAPSDLLAEQDTVRMSDLNNHDYLGRTSCEYHNHLRDARLALGGIEFNRPYTSDRDDWVQAMVMAGLGFTYLPEFAATVPGLVMRPLVEPEVTRTVQLVTVRDRLPTPAMGAFLRAACNYSWDGKVCPVHEPPQHAETESASDG